MIRSPSGQLPSEGRLVQLMDDIRGHGDEGRVSSRPISVTMATVSKSETGLVQGLKEARCEEWGCGLGCVAILGHSPFAGLPCKSIQTYNDIFIF